MSERYCQHMPVAHTCSRCMGAGRMESLRVQLAAAEKERDRFKELLDAPPYVDCICPGCPREVPHAWASGMCEPCANDDCEHTDGAKAVTEERDALADQLAATEKERDKWKAAHDIEDREKYAALQRENEREVERDAARAQLADLLANADADAFMLTQVGRERDALAARVARLEDALMRIRDIPESSIWEDDRDDAADQMVDIARIGLDGKEGK